MAKNGQNGQTVVAGHGTIAEQMRDVAIVSSVEHAKETSSASPMHKYFGEPTFRLPDGVARSYPNDRQPNRTGKRVAYASFVVGGLFEIDANIYHYETVIQGNDGPEIEDEMVLTLPSTGTRTQVFKIIKGRPDLALMLENWKYDVIGEYQVWEAKLLESQKASGINMTAASSGGTMLPRHISKRKAPEGTTVKANPATNGR